MICLSVVRSTTFRSITYARSTLLKCARVTSILGFRPRKISYFGANVLALPVESVQMNSVSQRDAWNLMLSAMPPCSASFSDGSQSQAGYPLASKRTCGWGASSSWPAPRPASCCTAGQSRASSGWARDAGKDDLLARAPRRGERISRS